jgi:D-beta-D-heptose 7-phosphate kinase/D-beta-D-heptose 1-phosphate adenosyltransferase
MKVWVNGTFDVMHLGHMRLLQFASKLGKVRVGLDTDERIKINKGENRPFNNLTQRIEFISGIKYVDSVVSFGNDEELIECIKEYNPDLMVIGSDYKGKKIIGSHLFEKIVFFDKLEGKSTSNILTYESSSDR